MSMISGKLGEDKQNKQEKSETAIRESIGVVPLALPLMAGPGAISSTIVWGTRYHSISPSLLAFPSLSRLFALCCWGIVPYGPLAGSCYLRQTGINVITPYYGAVADGIWGLNLSLLVLRGFSPACLINSCSNETELSCSVYFVIIFTLFPRELSKLQKFVMGENILLKLQLVIRISLTASTSPSLLFSPHHNLWAC